MQTYGELRKKLLTDIACARREYFRIKGELVQLEPTLPKGCYIGSYKSNYKWTYHALGHKESVLPCATDGNKFTKKLHLGKDGNPNYRRALLEIERMRTKQVKQETLEGIIAHLTALMKMYRYWQPKWQSHNLSDVIQMPGKKTSEEKQLLDFLSGNEESVFQFVVKQYIRSK